MDCCARWLGWLLMAAVALVFSSVKADEALNRCIVPALEQLLLTNVRPSLQRVRDGLQYAVAYPEVDAFQSDRLLKQGSERHLAEFGFSETQEYLDSALAFAHSEAEDIASYVGPKSGNIFRYRPSTNEYMVLSPTRQIMAYFKPRELDNRFNASQKIHAAWRYFLSKYYEDLPAGETSFSLEGAEFLKRALAELNIPEKDFVTFQIGRAYSQTAPTFVPPSRYAPQVMDPHVLHFMVSRRSEARSIAIIEEALRFRQEKPRLEDLDPLSIWRDSEGRRWTTDNGLLASYLLSGVIHQVPVRWLSAQEVDLVINTYRGFTTTNKGNAILLALQPKRGFLVRRMAR